MKRVDVRLNFVEMSYLLEGLRLVQEKSEELKVDPKYFDRLYERLEYDYNNLLEDLDPKERDDHINRRDKKI